MGARVQGERPAHRHVVLHGDLGREGGLEKSKRLMISVCFVGGGRVVLNESNSYIILFTVSSLFSDFPHRIQHSPESYSRPARHIQSNWGISYPKLSV